MQILVISNNPARASFRQRVEVHLDTLRVNGIECRIVKLPSGPFGRRRLFRRAGKFDGVFLHKKGLNFVDAAWLRWYGRKVIYDFDDAVMYSPKVPDRNSSSHLRRFRRTAKLADMVIAGNSYLAEHARKFNQSVEVLPTGLDTNRYSLETKPEDDGKVRLVWIGGRSTLRYLAEIKPALEEIGTRFTNVVLRMICDAFFDLKNMQVEKYRWQSETEACYLETSDIGLAPLPDNRFTRGKCGFKILQYAVAGLPVIASPVGVNSDYVRNGVTGLLATNTRQWTEKITLLIDDPKLRNKMGQANLFKVKQFDISVIGKKLTDLIKKCLLNVES